MTFKRALFVALIPECSHQLLQAVEGKLKGDPGVQERQLQLLSAIISDVSEPTKELLAKLNCGPKCECTFKFFNIFTATSFVTELS